MNDTIKSKVFCEVCSCLVVEFEHELRCRPRTEKGWNVQRIASWFGDTVHRLDVQLAVRMLDANPPNWESSAQAYTSNFAMAVYMRSQGFPCVGQSDHSVGTLFESFYFGDFRLKYLRASFPAVCEEVVKAWRPPVFGGSESST